MVFGVYGSVVLITLSFYDRLNEMVLLLQYLFKLSASLRENMIVFSQFFIILLILLIVQALFIQSLVVLLQFEGLLF